MQPIKKTPTQNMKGREENTDDSKRQGQHKRQAQIWKDTDKTNKSVCIAKFAQNYSFQYRNYKV